MDSTSRITLADAAVVLAVAGAWAGSGAVLGQGPELGFLAVLLVPCAYYHLVHAPVPDTVAEGPGKGAAWALLLYFFVYEAAMFRVNVLGASVALWLFLLVIPWLILRGFGCTLASVDFGWRRAFEGIRHVLVACLWLTPFLLYGVKDADKIRPMLATWRFYVYLPLSVLGMALMVALWEEFFFRGVLLSCLRSLVRSWVTPLFLSAALFGVYHFPMRYLNARSPYCGHALQALAATLNEQLLMGLFLGFVVYRSRNVWHGIWLHAYLNGISFVYQMTKMVKF